MFEKVNPSHPDKIADRIAGAMVDRAYEKVNGKPLCYEVHPKIAVEVLIGHGTCYIIIETSLGDITLCNNQTITIKPDDVCDFQELPFENESFSLAVFDPPHLIDKSDTAWLVKKYGTLPKEWQPVLQKGFAECMRVLKPNGVLIFKWNEVLVPTSTIIKLFGNEDKLLFGHKSGKRSNTNWLVYMK